MSDIKTTFTEFLNQAVKAKEVILVLAQDENEQMILQDLLTQANFSALADVFDLMEKVKVGGKYFLTIKSDTGSEDLKKYYDFIIQYPTGQIEIFNKEKLASIVAVPNYQATVILSTTKAALNNCQKQNIDFLSAVGLTYQS